MSMGGSPPGRSSPLATRGLLLAGWVMPGGLRPMFPPELPLTNGQMATILVVTEASLVATVLMLRRTITLERKKANNFRHQLLGAIQQTAGIEGIISQMLLPIGQAIAHRVANPPPKAPKPLGTTKGKATEPIVRIVPPPTEMAPVEVPDEQES